MSRSGKYQMLRGCWICFCIWYEKNVHTFIRLTSYEQGNRKDKTLCRKKLRRTKHYIETNSLVIQSVKGLIWSTHFAKKRFYKRVMMSYLYQDITHDIWDNIGILNVNEFNGLSPNFTAVFTTKFYKLNMWHDFITTAVPSTQLRDSHEIAFDRIKVWLSFY